MAAIRPAGAQGIRGDSDLVEKQGGLHDALEVVIADLETLAAEMQPAAEVSPPGK